jgi:hypothetical protein
LERRKTLNMPLVEGMRIVGIDFLTGSCSSRSAGEPMKGGMEIR